MQWSAESQKYKNKIFITSGRGRIALGGFIELHNQFFKQPFEI